jgi:putative membrane protein insertion efficiency factor
MKRIALAAIRGYQLGASPLFGARCKYHPSCSQYAAEAIGELGLPRGLVLAGWRLLRCNPWSHGGVDYARDQQLFRRKA